MAAPHLHLLRVLLMTTELSGEYQTRVLAKEVGGSFEKRVIHPVSNWVTSEVQISVCGGNTHRSDHVHVTC